MRRVLVVFSPSEERGQREGDCEVFSKRKYLIDAPKKRERKSAARLLGCDNDDDDDDDDDDEKMRRGHREGC